MKAALRNLPKRIRLVAPNGAINNVVVARSYWARGMGLLGAGEPLPDDQGLLLLPCSSVHGFWMRITIDVVFFNSNWEVLKVFPRCRPWRYLASCRGAAMALELGEGAIERLGLVPGVACRWEVPREEHPVSF